MESIQGYLLEKYRPLAMIVYGSYADGSNGEHSDFDALLIVQGGEKAHDASFVDGVQLDAFVCPRAQIEGDFDPEEFVQVFDGKIVCDTDDLAQNLQEKVREHLRELPVKNAEEIRDEIAWCEKMLARVQRGDAEGFYRWHWLLTDSLEIAFDILREPYFGPKKSLRWLEKNRKELFSAYAKALGGMDFAAAADWISILRAEAGLNGGAHGKTDF